MKKILTSITTIGLLISSTSTVISCGKTNTFLDFSDKVTIKTDNDYEHWRWAFSDWLENQYGHRIDGGSLAHTIDGISDGVIEQKASYYLYNEISYNSSLDMGIYDITEWIYKTDKYETVKMIEFSIYFNEST